MMKFNGIVPAMKYAAGNVSNWNTCINSLRLNNILSGVPSNIGNTGLKSCGVNLIQTRNRHVMDDAMEPHRTYRHDKITGLKTSSEIVLKKFFRLRWGGWIRTMGGKNKDLWMKDLTKHRHHKKHVFCTAKQCTTLDKMVTDEYKEPHYYVDDPYEPYHSKESFINTRTKPLPPSKNVYQYLDD